MIPFHQSTSAILKVLRPAMLLIASAGIASAQSGNTPDDQTASGESAPAPVRLRAVRTSTPIVIDGRLDEPEWLSVEPASDFRQRDPDEGEPATQRTLIRVLFDDRYLYFGIRAFDSQPGRILARELLRDASFSNDDKIHILIDTHHDRRNAYRFTVNPLGTQQDALISDDGREINLAWDAPWISKATIDDGGFTIEIAIPLTSLRFREGSSTWGINFSRTIRRGNEENLWSGWQRAFGIDRVSQAGILHGVEQIGRRRLVEIKPYVASGWRRGVGGSPGGPPVSGFTGDAGLEVVKLGITPALTAELTVNPDFGQVEVDQQMVNLSRFSLFFPEKRDFFLENAGVFLFGRQRVNQLFFTRRIGLTDSGEPLPIDYGAKITGRIGPYNLGFLQIQTRRVADPLTDTILPRQHFTVARVKRDLFRRSYVGAMIVNREDGRSSRYNRGAGMDVEMALTDHWRISGFLMGTLSPDRNAGVGSGRVTSSFENDLFSLTTLYERIGKDFNPEVGFAFRTGVNQYFGEAAFKPRPTFIPYVRQMFFESQFEYYESTAGKLETRQNQFTWETLFNDSSEFEIGFIEDVTDVLDQPFEIRPGITIPAGVYRFNRPHVSFNSDRSKRILFSVTDRRGAFFSGTRRETTAALSWRPNAHVLVELNESHNRVRLPQGNFSTNLFGARLNYNHSRQLLSSALIQLNSAARLSSVNLRFRYIFRPHSDFFLIWNQTTGRGLERPSYQLRFKLTYNFTL